MSSDVLIPTKFTAAMNHYLSNRISLAILCFESFLLELSEDQDNTRMFSITDTEFATQDELRMLSHRYLCLIYLFGLNGLVDFGKATYHGEQAAKFQDAVGSILLSVLYLKGLDVSHDEQRLDEVRDLIGIALRSRGEERFEGLLSRLTEQVPLLKQVVEEVRADA